MDMLLNGVDTIHKDISMNTDFKSRFDETLVDNVDLLCTVTDEELKQFIDSFFISTQRN